MISFNTADHAGGLTHLGVLRKLKDEARISGLRRRQGALSFELRAATSCGAVLRLLSFRSAQYYVMLLNLVNI
jgi:hypothetical protein